MREAPKRIWIQDDTRGHIDDLIEMSVRPVDEALGAFTEYLRADLLRQAVLDAREARRLRSLMGRYVEHVGTEEGTDFLHRSSDWITEAEADELRAAGKAARKLGEQP